MNYTTKRELKKMIQRIISGADAHTNIIFGKIKNKWAYQTGVCEFNLTDFSELENPQQAAHCCNSITLEQIENLYF